MGVYKKDRHIHGMIRKTETYMELKNDRHIRGICMWVDLYKKDRHILGIKKKSRNIHGIEKR